MYTGYSLTKIESKPLLAQLHPSYTTYLPNIPNLNHQTHSIPEQSYQAYLSPTAKQS